MRTPRLVNVVLAAVFACSGCTLSLVSAEPGSLAEGVALEDAEFTVGSKEFTEQQVLCYLTALALDSVGADVVNRCGLSGSNVVREGLTSGAIDMYWEYTGTAWVNYLQETEPIPDPVRQYEAVAEQDLARNGVRWLPPAPADNTYAIAATEETADRLGVSTVSEYAELVRTDPSAASLCVATEFVARDDGLPGLQDAYDFEVPPDNLATLALGAIFTSVDQGDPCNFGEVFATDGRIQALDLRVLEDDRRFFPSFNPALAIRQDVLDDHPDVARVIEPLTGELTNETLRALNAEVDIDGRDPKRVAEDWLKHHGFIG